MFKKIFFGIMAIVAVMTVAGTMTSCKPVKSGTNLYEVEIKGFDDNMDLLRNAVEKDFEKLGLAYSGGSHIYVLEGEVKKCNKLATDVFQQCCKAVDQDRSKLALPLALKGKTIALKHTYGGEPEEELSTYTFVEEDK